MRRPAFSTGTWLLVGFAVFIWLLVATAGISMACGNQTAINAVVGGSVPGVFVTAWAVGFARQDVRHRR